MATLEIGFLHDQLRERKRRLEEAIAVAPQNGGLTSLLRQVDSALERMAKGSYGLCQECHKPVEKDRLLADGTLLLRREGVALESGRLSSLPRTKDTFRDHHVHALVPVHELGDVQVGGDA